MRGSSLRKFYEKITSDFLNFLRNCCVPGSPPRTNMPPGGTKTFLRIFNPYRLVLN